MSTSLSAPALPAPASTAISMFQTADLFRLVQEQAKLVASSTLIPKEFQGNVANCAIALEMAARIGASPFAVLQNLYIVHGRPSWSAIFLMGLINSCGRFTPLEFRIEKTGAEKTVGLEIDCWEGFGPNRRKTTRKVSYTYTPTTCVAFATSKATGAIVESPPVSFDMALEEGWVAKDGSKWLTSMRDVMLRYRAASFFAKVHASDYTLGMQTSEELHDAPDPGAMRNITPPSADSADPLASALGDSAPPAAESDNPPPTQQRRATRPAAKPAPQAEEKPAPAAQSVPSAAPPTEAPAAAKGFPAYYERYVVTRSPAGSAKEWTKFTLHYSIPNGPSRTADTFRSSLIEPLDQLEEGALIHIETTPNSNPRYADTLESLQVPAAPASAPAKTQTEGDLPWE